VTPTWVVSVLAGVESAMFAECLVTPAVVADNGVFDWTFVIQPREERRGVPVPIWRLPLAVGPQNLGFVVFDLDAQKKTSYYFGSPRNGTNLF